MQEVHDSFFTQLAAIKNLECTSNNFILLRNGKKVIAFTCKEQEGQKEARQGKEEASAWSQLCQQLLRRGRSLQQKFRLFARTDDGWPEANPAPSFF